MKPLSLAHLPPDAWLFALVFGVLAFHIAAAGVGIVSGYVAAFAAKGRLLHRRAGTLFVVAMVAMAAAATFLAIRIQQRGNIAAGVFVAYLVLSGWMTVRREAGRIGRFEIAAFLVAGALAGAMAASGLEARMSPTGTLDSYPAGPYFVLAIIIAFFAWGDLRMILRGGVEGKRRLSRHVGRMGFAFFIAAGFFFLGRQKTMPAFIQGSPVLLVLGLAPLGLMIFWLVRIGRGDRRQLAPAAP
jgi:FtsH-binding integral membrane protein